MDLRESYEGNMGEGERNGRVEMLEMQCTCV